MQSELLQNNNKPNALVHMVGQVLSHVILDEGMQINLYQAPSLAPVMEGLKQNEVIVSDFDGPASDFGKMTTRILSDVLTYEEAPGVLPEDVIPEWERIKNCAPEAKNSTFIVTTRPSEDETIELNMADGENKTVFQKTIDYVKALPSLIYRGSFQSLWKEIKGFNPIDEFKKIGIDNISFEPNRRNPKSDEFQASVQEFLEKNNDTDTINFVFDVLTVDSIVRDAVTLVGGAFNAEKFDEYHSEIVAIKAIMKAAKELNIDIKKLNIILTNRTLFKETKLIGTISN